MAREPDYVLIRPGAAKHLWPQHAGKPRVDDRRVLSLIVFINRSGLRRCDAPKEYGPLKTLYNSWKRFSDKGVFARMMDGLAVRGPAWQPARGGVVSGRDTRTSPDPKEGSEERQINPDEERMHIKQPYATLTTAVAALVLRASRAT